MSLSNYFTHILPVDRITESAEDLAFYGADSSKQFVGRPAVILFPVTTVEVQAIVRCCIEKRIALVPSGGRTGYSGGATATMGEAIISMAKMNKIINVSVEDSTLSCEAGVTTEVVRQKANEHGLLYPVDFASKGSSHIGGNIATNAGGIRVIRYGNTRDWVLGLTVVSGGGEILHLNGSLHKNQTGYDLRHLFIGSEGTLGIITEATLKLTLPPKAAELFVAGLEQPARLLEVLSCLRKAGFTINVFEYFEANALSLVCDVCSLPKPFPKEYPAYALIEIEVSGAAEIERLNETLAETIESGVCGDMVQAQSSKQREQLMALRERISESINKRHVPHKNDISVPVAKIPAFLEDFRAEYLTKNAGLEAIVFGHIGDGNLHINILKPAQKSKEDFFDDCVQLDNDLFALVAQFSGSISAEHGVGLLKRDFLHYSRSQEEIGLMQQIKHAFDPHGILNPGKVFGLPTSN